MDNLVDDCLLHIFKFVHLKEWPALGEVCPRWKTLISGLWRKSITLKMEIPKEDAPTINREEILRIARYFAPMIHSVELHPEGPNNVISFGNDYEYAIDNDEPHRHTLTNDLFRVLSECAFNIKSLYLGMVIVDWILITKLLIHNKGLKTFKAFFLFEEMTDYLPDTLESIKWFQSNHLNEKYTGFMRRECKLRKLHMFSNNGVASDLTLQAVSENPSKLESLCMLIYPTEMNDGSLMSLHCLNSFFCLKKLHLSGPQITISDQEAVSVVSRCVQLEQVKLCFLTASNKAISRVMGLPRLRKLKLNRITSLSQLKPISTMAHLRKLSFRAEVAASFDYDCIVAMLNKTPQLSKLIFPHDLYLPIRVICDIIATIVHRPQQVLTEPMENYFANYLQITFSNVFYMPLYETTPANAFMLVLEADLMNLLVTDMENHSVPLRGIVCSMKRNENKSTAPREEIVEEEELYEEESESETDDDDSGDDDDDHHDHDHVHEE